MAGGLIEGLKKCYTGNNVFIKHIFLAILGLVISVPTCIATVSTSGKEADVYLYMFFIAPFLGIVSMIASFILGYYMVLFIRNTLKFCFWKETEKDETKIKALQIMPEVDASLFNINIFKWLAFCIIWMLMIIITAIINMQITNSFFIFSLLCAFSLGRKFAPFHPKSQSMPAPV